MGRCDDLLRKVGSAGEWKAVTYAYLQLSGAGKSIQMKVDTGALISQQRASHGRLVPALEAFMPYCVINRFSGRHCFVPPGRFGVTLGATTLMLYDNRHIPPRHARPYADHYADSRVQ